jgi:hypothetical protein
MSSSELGRHQLIQSLLAQRSEQAVDVAIHLWEKLSLELLLIVGDEGFSAIYARSVYLCRSSFGWLTESTAQDQARFTPLRTSLQGQSPEQVEAASRLLLTTFTDILATLIGDGLTDHLLDSAWGTAPTTGTKES